MLACRLGCKNSSGISSSSGKTRLSPGVTDVSGLGDLIGETEGEVMERGRLGPSCELRNESVCVLSLRNGADEIR